MVIGASSTYTYNGDGVRTKKVSGGTTTDYFQDPSGSLPLVAAEKVGSAWTHYLYGANLIARLNSSSVAHCYHYDGSGNVRAITDSNGDVVERYDYDAFGGLRNTPGGLTNDRRFSGEQNDGESGYVFLRARYYDPAIGRFTGRDPAKDGTNWYAYAGNNPVNRVDPTGLVTYVFDGVYTDSFQEYSQMWDQHYNPWKFTEPELEVAEPCYPTTCPQAPAPKASGEVSAPTRLSSTELNLSCPTGQYWFLPEWNPCTGTENELFGAYASWFIPLPMGGLSRVFMKAAGLTAQEAISAFKQASIGRRFPGQFLNSTLEEMKMQRLKVISGLELPLSCFSTRGLINERNEMVFCSNALRIRSPS